MVASERVRKGAASLLLICMEDHVMSRSTSQFPFTNQGGLWGPSWKVSFELFINSYTRGHIAPDGYANVFHITATGNECCSIGDRYPAFLTNRNGFIHFATQIGDRGNAFWDSPQLPPRVWYGIEAEQRFKNGKVGKIKEYLFENIFNFSI